MTLTKTLYALGISVLLVFSAGCNTQNSGGKGTASVPASQSHSLNLSLSSLYSGVISRTASSKSTTAVSAVLTGELQAINYTTGLTTNFSWSAELDETAFTIQSTKTVTLEPGSYRFSMLLSSESYQYAGESFATVIDGNATDIPMTLTPVIGDTVVDVSVISTLSDYHFSYDAAELASLSLPKLGVTVDGGLEQIFTVNKTTGLTDSYINLTDGSHTIRLALYDDTQKVGRSVEEQESVIILAGSPVTMDIVPLHAETAFTFNTTDGNATITTAIPSEIIDITGIANLQTVFTLTDGGTSYEQNMSLYTENNITYGTITLDTLNYGNYAMQLVFSDTTNPTTPIGSCLMDNVLLDKNGSTVECAVTVATPSLASGSILASVGLNVYDTNSQPVAGAMVYANNELIGITGSGTFGTEGFLAIDLPAGNVIFKAETNTSRGEINASLNSLDVRNFDIILDSTANIHDLFEDGSIVATYTFDTDGHDLGGIYNTSLLGGATVDTAKIDNGLLIDSIGEVAKMDTALPNLQQFTISLFVQTDSYVNDGVLVSLHGNNDIGLVVYSGNLYKLYHQPVTGIGANLESNTTFSLGEMHHIVATGDGSMLKLYVDGNLEDNASYNGTTKIAGYYDSIGGNDNNLSTFRGRVDQLRIFNRAVTQDEITQLLNEY